MKFLPFLFNRVLDHYNCPMIRKPTPDDLSRLAEIHVYGWRVAYRDIVPEIYLYKDRQVASGIEMHRSILLQTPENIDLYDDGIVRGFALHSPARDEDKPAAYELGAIYVEPAFQGTGVGSALIGHVERRARDLGKPEVIVWAFERNAPARRFYEKHGYSPDGVSKTIEEWQARELRYVKAL